MLILDSNTISYYFRGEPEVVSQLQAQSPGDLAVPAIVEYELRYGLLRFPREAAAWGCSSDHFVETNDVARLRQRMRSPCSFNSSRVGKRWLTNWAARCFDCSDCAPISRNAGNPKC